MPLAETLAAWGAYLRTETGKLLDQGQPVATHVTARRRAGTDIGISKASWATCDCINSDRPPVVRGRSRLATPYAIPTARLTKQCCRYHHHSQQNITCSSHNIAHAYFGQTAPSTGYITFVQRACGTAVLTYATMGLLSAYSQQRLRLPFQVTFRSSAFGPLHFEHLSSMDRLPSERSSS